MNFSKASFINPLGLCLLALLLIQALMAGPVDGQEDKLDQLINLWRDRQYEMCLPGLLEFRDEPYGKNVWIDYMIATSACRIDEVKDLGRSYFALILSSYRLRPESRQKVEHEQARCSRNVSPITIAFADLWGTGGAGVRGKTFYWLNRPNAPLVNETIEVVEKVPKSEIQKRLAKPEDREDAVQYVKNLAGRKFRVESSGGFVIASSGRQSRSELQDMAHELDRVSHFFTAFYGMAKPPYLITVYLVPDPYELRGLAKNIHGLRLTEESIGYSYRDDLSIAGVLPGTRIGTLKHELFHLMVRNNFGDIPPWLDEGIAALYEVSLFEGDRVMGTPNWRGPVLKRFWNRRPNINHLMRMSWVEFDAEETGRHHYNVEQQAANHATARYFALYLQEKGQLGNVYSAFRNRNVTDAFSAPGDQRIKLLEDALGQPLEDADQEFADWFASLDTGRRTRENIADAQQRLKNLNFDPGLVDGLMGSNTKDALRAFQKTHGLPVTGKLDVATMSALRALTGKE